MIRPDKNGDIFLVDQKSETIKIASIQHGITFGKTIKTRKVARVTIYPGQDGVSDIFFFVPGEGNWELFFQHVMSRDIHPELQRIYLTFFANEKDYAPVAFIQQLIENYFIGELCYQKSHENT